MHYVYRVCLTETVWGNPNPYHIQGTVLGTFFHENNFEVFIFSLVIMRNPKIYFNSEQVALN